MTRYFYFVTLATPLWMILITIFQPSFSQASEEITYRLKWLYNTSVAGDLYALDKEFFKREGLAVEVKAGSPERDAIREIELGQAQFGVASGDQVILARKKGSPVVVVAQIFQKNPLQWIYREGPFSLKSLPDLKGKTIGITYGGNDEAIMRALLKAGGIAENEVNFYSVRYDYTPFYQNRVPIWPVYINSQGVILSGKLSENNEKTAFFDPTRHGVRFVANAVITSAKMLQNEPETVKSFAKALLEGWREALDPLNEEETLLVLKKYDRDTPPHIRKAQLALTRPLVLPDNGQPVGSIDRAAWRETESIMLEQNLISGPVHVTEALFQNGSAGKE